MKELTEILDEECEVYSKYLKLAGKKREALIKNNIDCNTILLGDFNLDCSKKDINN